MSGGGQGYLPVESIMAETRRFRHGLTLINTGGHMLYRGMIQCGNAAIKAQDALGKGAYGEWLRKEFTVTPRTVRNWKQIARTGLTPEQIVQEGGLRAILEPAQPETVSGSVEAADAPDPPKTDTVSVLSEPPAPKRKRTARGLYADGAPLSYAGKLKQKIVELELAIEGYEHNAAEKTAAENLRLRQVNAELREANTGLLISQENLTKQRDLYRSHADSRLKTGDALREALRELDPDHELLGSQHRVV